MAIKIVIDEKENVDVYFIGDLHIGSKTFLRKEFEETINKIAKQKNARVILMGDQADLIEEDDTRRYDPANIDPNLCSAEKQMSYLKTKLYPIKNKIYGILRGNHEASYAKYHKHLFSIKTRDYAEELAQSLKVPYLEDLGIINLKVGRIIRKDYHIAVAHGCGTSVSLTSQIKALCNIVNNFEVTPDVMAIGHVHSLQTILNPKINYDFNLKIKHLALTGSFYRTYQKNNMNYASGCLYNPLPLGYIKYSFDNKGHIRDEKILVA